MIYLLYRFFHFHAIENIILIGSSMTSQAQNERGKTFSRVLPFEIMEPRIFENMHFFILKFDTASKAIETML